MKKEQADKDIANYDAKAFCNFKGKTFLEVEVLMFPFSSFHAKILQQGVKSFQKSPTIQDYSFRTRRGREGFMLRNGILMAE